MCARVRLPTSKQSTARLVSRYVTCGADILADRPEPATTRSARYAAIDPLTSLARHRACLEPPTACLLPPTRWTPTHCAPYTARFQLKLTITILIQRCLYNVKAKAFSEQKIRRWGRDGEARLAFPLTNWLTKPLMVARRAARPATRDPRPATKIAFEGYFLPILNEFTKFIVGQFQVIYKSYSQKSMIW